MAVIPRSSVYYTFRRRVFLLLLSLQVVLVFATLGLLWGLGLSVNTQTLLGMGSLLVLSTIVFIAVSHYLAKPVRDIEEFAQNIISSVANDSLPNPPKQLKNGLIGREVTEIMQHIYEVTEQSQQEKFKLGSAGVSMQSLFKDLPAGCIIFNEKAELSLINPRACSLLGITAEAASTEEVLRLVQSLRVNGSTVRFVDWLHQVRTSQIKAFKQWSSVLLSRDDEKGGTIDTMFDLIASFHKRDARSYELILLMVDKTENYQQQEKQMEFISLAAHELRGPITVMRGLIDIFKNEVSQGLTKDQSIQLTRMSVSARQLASYVDNILNVSRIDRENYEVHQEEVDWNAIMTKAVPELEERATAHNRKLTTGFGSDLPTVAADTSAVQHVINNLVDNAIKYSKDGGEIIVSTKIKDAFVETTVQDFGIGIPASLVGNLFVKFYRSHRSKQSVSGTGLGLYLCKAIVESHGGNIWVSSSEGLGTTFGFTLPTYASVEAELKNNPNETNGIVRRSHGWIKNHALYRR